MSAETSLHDPLEPEVKMIEAADTLRNITRFSRADPNHNTFTYPGYTISRIPGVKGITVLRGSQVRDLTVQVDYSAVYPGKRYMPVEEYRLSGGLRRVVEHVVKDKNGDPMYEKVADEHFNMLRDVRLHVHKNKSGH